MTYQKTNLKIFLMDLSVVVPVYNEEESIQELTEWIKKVCTNDRLSYEIIFIDDGSTDSSWNRIMSVAVKDHFVKVRYFIRAILKI